MEKNIFAYLYMFTIFLCIYTTTNACPTCVGRIRLGHKKPFFKLYRPHSKSKYAKKRDLLKEALSYKKTGTKNVELFSSHSFQK
ncbi:hypothetical protein KAH94_04565 [bacterium]|nr:hypothetical protein [bacterium]